MHDVWTRHRTSGRYQIRTVIQRLVTCWQRRHCREVVKFNLEITFLEDISVSYGGRTILPLGECASKPGGVQNELKENNCCRYLNDGEVDSQLLFEVYRHGRVKNRKVAFMSLEAWLENRSGEKSHSVL